MWLLYKARNNKVNGCNLIAHVESKAEFASYVAKLLHSIKNSDEVLAMVNRYVNLKFAQQLPENLPHIPSWILAAQAYVFLSNNHPNSLSGINDTLVLQDIISLGEEIVKYIVNLSQQETLWQKLNINVEQNLHTMAVRWHILQDKHDTNFVAAMSKMYQHLHMLPQQWLADSNSQEQLEYFNPITVDVSDLFAQHILPHIPAEFVVADRYELGKLQIKFSVDAHTNTFADVHIPYGDEFLPDCARDVIFKIETYFKAANNETSYLLATSWLAYDLGTAAQRFENYYNGKFQYKLKHKRYHWISIDGRSNQVEGHGNTQTHKLIDYQLLANTYAKWLKVAVPANFAEPQQRLLQNAKFKQTAMLLTESKSCTTLNQQHVELLRAVLHNELIALMLNHRQALALSLQQDFELCDAVAQVDALYAILEVFARLLNCSFVDQNFGSKFKDFLNNMRQVSSLDSNLQQEFNNLLICNDFISTEMKAYEHGELYNKLQETLARLKILQAELTISKLQFF